MYKGPAVAFMHQGPEGPWSGPHGAGCHRRRPWPGWTGLALSLMLSKMRRWFWLNTGLMYSQS